MDKHLELGLPGIGELGFYLAFLVWDHHMQELGLGAASSRPGLSFSSPHQGAWAR